MSPSSFLPQEAPRHEDAINAITEYLEIGSYKDWDEDTKVKWLVKELEVRLPAAWVLPGWNIAVPTPGCLRCLDSVGPGCQSPAGTAPAAEPAHGAVGGG